VEVEYLDGDPQRYLMSIGFAFGEAAGRILSDNPESVLCRVTGDEGEGVLYDVASSREFATAVTRLMTDRKKVAGDTGALRATATHRSALSPDLETLDVRSTDNREGHTSIMLGDQVVLKLYRRVETGVNPDLEIRRFLTEQTTLENLPAVLGWLEYQGSEDDATTLGIVESYVPHEGQAWDQATAALGRLFETVLADDELNRPDLPPGSLSSLARRVPPPEVAGLFGADLQAAETLAQRTVELHLALASEENDAEFRPGRFTTLAQRSLYQSLRGEIRQDLARARRALEWLPDETRGVVERVAGREQEILDRLRKLVSTRLDGKRIRLHGDYRLEEILASGNDYIFFDFAGDTTRPMSERRLKQSPLKDVADLLRSLHYAALAGLYEQVEMGAIPPDRFPDLEPWATLWYRWVSASFLRTYLHGMSDSGLLPSDEQATAVLLEAFMMEKAARELVWEVHNRPTWASIPAQGLLAALDDS
jgi:maltose alpha-D-glucosyltransferase/alpha-amylase